ncbi:MAG: regulatory protein RecX [Planctomycetota bacterium]
MAKRPPTREELPAEGRITAIRPRPDGLRVRLVVDDVFRIDVEPEAARAVSPGDPWTPETAEAMWRSAHFASAKRRAMNTLGARAVSRGELIKRLIRSGHDAEASERAADRMGELGLVNDEAFARSVASSTVSGKPAGRRLVETKLRSKGIPAELARRVADETADSRDALADAVSLARTRAERMDPGLPRETVYRRLTGLLARRGFDAEVCREAVARVVKADS